MIAFTFAQSVFLTNARSGSSRNTILVREWDLTFISTSMPRIGFLERLAQSRPDSIVYCALMIDAPWFLSCGAIVCLQSACLIWYVSRVIGRAQRSTHRKRGNCRSAATVKPHRSCRIKEIWDFAKRHVVPSGACRFYPCVSDSEGVFSIIGDHAISTTFLRIALSGLGEQDAQHPASSRSINRFSCILLCRTCIVRRMDVNRKLKQKSLRLGEAEAQLFRTRYSAQENRSSEQRRVTNPTDKG